jgi:predicted O-methyltransferase YrrM
MLQNHFCLCSEEGFEESLVKMFDSHYKSKAQSRGKKIMLKRILGFVLSIWFLQAEKLPAPYDSLTTVHPFVDFGWYQNGGYLRELIMEYRVRTIIEVGVFLGQSTMDLAKHLPEGGVVYAVDHFLGSPEHQPGHGAWHPCVPYLYEQFLSNVIHENLTHKIIPVRQESLEAAKSLKGIQPDLIFIDASHETEAVYQDLCAWFPLVQGRGILCGDDWLWESVRIAVERFAQDRDLIVAPKGGFWRLMERK